LGVRRQARSFNSRKDTQKEQRGETDRQRRDKGETEERQRKREMERGAHKGDIQKKIKE